MAKTLADWERWQRRCGRLHKRGLSRRLTDDLLTLHGDPEAERLLRSLEQVSDEEVRRLARARDEVFVDTYDTLTRLRLALIEECGRADTLAGSHGGFVTTARIRELLRGDGRMRT